MKNLNPRRHSILTALVDAIFPADEHSPSASSLGVVDYMKRQLNSPWGRGEDLYDAGPHIAPSWKGLGWQSALTPAQAIREGLDALDAHASVEFGHPFAVVTSAQQGELIESLATGTARPIGDVPADQFFLLLQNLVLQGLFRDPSLGGNRDFAGRRWLEGDVTSKARTGV